MLNVQVHLHHGRTEMRMNHLQLKAKEWVNLTKCWPDRKHSTYIDFKSRPNWSTVLIVRILVALGRTQVGKSDRGFWKLVMFSFLIWVFVHGCVYFVKVIRLHIYHCVLISMCIIHWNRFSNKTKHQLYHFPIIYSCL